MRRAAPSSILSSLLAGVLLAAPVAEAQISISGRVQLPDGAPAGGIEVELQPQMGRYEFGLLVLAGRHQPEPAARATTRDDGSFALQAPAPGMWRLSVAAEGYRPVQLHLLPLFEDQLVPPLELTPEVAVKIRVLDANGEPAAGARVLADAPLQESRFGLPDAWRASHRQAFTDEQGVALLSRAPDEALQIAIRFTGHQKAELASVDGSSVSARLEAASTLPVKVLDRRGQAVSAAQILAGDRRWPIGTTDASGSLALPLPAEGRLWIRALAADGGTAEKWLERSDMPSDQPIEVTLSPPAIRYGRLLDRQSKSPIAGALAWRSGDPAAFVQTDSTGTYALPVPAGKDTWIWGAAAGYLKEGVQSASGAASGPTLALQRSVRAAGVVVNEADQPVAGVEIVATVDLGRRTRRTSFGAFRQLERAVTDARGHFSIGSLHPEVSYLLTAEKPGFAKAELSLPNPGSDTEKELRITLETGRLAIGRVVGPSGEPVPGARVELEKSLSGGNPRQMILARMTGRQRTFEAFTDGSGAFSLQDLGAGTYELEASAAGYAKTRVAALEVLELSPETDLGEVTLELGVSIEGRVSDQDGTPIEGARVLVSEHGTERSFRVVRNNDDIRPAAFTDANGFFAVPDRRAGEKVDLTIQMSGFASERLPGVEAPTSRPLVVRMERASAVRGQVVDASGRAVAGADLSIQIHVTTGQTSMSRTGGNATSGENGRFVIENVDPGEIQLTAKADGFRTTEVKSLTVEPGKDLEDVRVTLEPGAAVSGRVTDPSGRPLAFAVLMVHKGTRTGFAAGFGSFARTDGEGRYRLEGVAPGRQSITARHDDYEPVTRELEVQLGDNTLDFTFTGGVEISGRVLDEAGAPIAGAEISVDSSRVGMWSGQKAVSDTSGAFNLGGLAEGTYSLRAEHAGYAPGRLEDLEVGVAGLPGVEFRLSPGLAITGQLYGLEDANMLDIEIFAFSEPRYWRMGTVGAGGTYRVEDLAPGRYTVSAEVAANGLSATDDVEVFPGARETVLDLYFKTGLTLTGQVFKGDEPLRGAYLTLVGIDVSSRSGGNSDNDGRFEIRGIEPGRHTLMVGSLQTGLDHREELDITSSREVVVRISTAKLSGVVLDANESRALSGASVALEPLEPADTPGPSRMLFSVTSDSSGFFRISEASSGSYRMVVAKDGYAPIERTVVVGDGLDQENMEVRLTPTEGVRVFVTLPSGRPASEFSASIVDAAGRPLTTGLHTADEQGSVRLSIPPGNWDLFVSAAGTAVWSSPISAPSEPISIALSEEAILRVLVPELEDSSVLAQVKVTGSDGRTHRNVQWVWSTETWALARGRARILGLAAGSWSVQVEAPDGRVWQGQATLGAGENPELVLR